LELEDTIFDKKEQLEKIQDYGLNQYFHFGNNLRIHKLLKNH